jgi:curved DNA-binding protein CbpA
MAVQPDPYTELGLPPDATTAEIRHEFRRRLREHHPDTREQDAVTAPTSDLALQRLIAAYTTLRKTGPEASQATQGNARKPKPTQQPATSPRHAGQEATLRVTPLHWVPARQATQGY